MPSVYSFVKTEAPSRCKATTCGKKDCTFVYLQEVYGQLRKLVNLHTDKHALLWPDYPNISQIIIVKPPL